MLLAATTTSLLGGTADASTAQRARPAATAGTFPGYGAVPTRAWLKAHPGYRAAHAASSINLMFGGGVDGVGVTTGKERVYLVFWGSQWGTEGTNAQGNATFSGDPTGMAPDLQAFLRGLGTGGETWSGVMTQYCEGVPAGAQTCPANSSHVAYPAGGALAGVWEDASSPAPVQPDGNGIGNEAVAAATHFGNTTQASNRDTQYVVVSPTGNNPDNYKKHGFCAWHDYTADPAHLSGGPVDSPDGELAFTNLPYIPDAGANCGAGFVNPGNSLDGVTIVEGHEYAETITDQFPAGGWTDSTVHETGDKCAWIHSGQGASQDLSLTTGTFAVQSTWANDFGGGTGGCEVSHPIVGGDVVTVSNPGNQSTLQGYPVSLQISASDSAGQALTYTASGLPRGLSINSSTGLVSGSPTTPGTSSVTVVATDPLGGSGSASFSWTVRASFEVAYQASDGTLRTVGINGTQNWGLGMAGGTSPSIAPVSGGFEVAFQANNGHLWTAGAAGTQDWGYVMAPGTSPSITAVPGGYEVAFQANGSSLWTVGTEGTKNWGLGMAAGTNPSITAVSGGYEAVFQANNGILWGAGALGTGPSGLAMAGGTSPSITMVPGASYEVAFQASSGVLWTTTPTGSTNWGIGMAGGTSPSITAVGGGFEAALQANTGALWTAGTHGTGSWGLGMAGRTNPAITTLGQNFVMAFQANTGILWTAGAAGTQDWGIGMAAGTSPSITT